MKRREEMLNSISLLSNVSIGGGRGGWIGI